MADLTIAAAPGAASSDRAVGISRDPVPPIARPLGRRAVAMVIASATACVASVGLVVALVADLELERRRAEQTVRSDELDAAFRQQQLLNARVAILTEDARQRLGEQLAALESDEGFLE